MFAVCVTRFDTKTWEENRSWREEREQKGCIYGCPVRISDQIMPGVPIFVLEMHNDENAIKGIGLIRNKVRVGKEVRIYRDRHYNRYTYKGGSRIDQREFSEEEKKIIVILEELLFYGKRHLKRGHGIQLLPVQLTAQRALLRIFAKELVHRSNFRPIGNRLRKGGLTPTWTESNNRLRLRDWLRGVFQARRSIG